VAFASAGPLVSLLLLTTITSSSNGDEPNISAVSRDLTSNYVWGFKSGVKQQHGSYKNGRSVHAVVRRAGTSLVNGYPDYLVWFSEHTGQSASLERAVAYPQLGKYPATHAVFASDAAAGDQGRFWWVMGGRADSQPFDLFRTVELFNPFVQELVLNDFVAEFQSTTPGLAVVGESGLLAYRWRASGSNTGEVRFRLYDLPPSGLPTLRSEKSIGRAGFVTGLNDVTIEQLWTRWDPRHRAFALTWQWFQHNAIATPNGKAFGSNPFLYTDDHGATWKSADGTPVALPLNYVSATASPVITPYEHFRRNESTGWLPRDIGFTPGGVPWITLATGPIEGGQDGWTLTLFRWDGLSWQAVPLSTNMEGDTDAMACGPVRDYLVCAYSELGTPGSLLVKVSRDEGRTWSSSVAVDNVGLAESGALQRINWVSYSQPADRYLDNTARFFVGYYRVGDTEGKDFKNRLRFVRVQVGPRADFNSDGMVNDSDFLDFEAARAASDWRADFNDDGGIDILDFDAFSLAMAGVEPGLPPEPPPDPPDPPDDPDPDGPAFQQAADGLVSIEAESHEAQPLGWFQVSRSGVANGHLLKAVSGAATPNSDRSHYAEYRVHFSRTGNHTVWTRMRGFSSSQYRLRAGLDALGPVVLGTSTDGVWRWKKLGTRINVPTTGTHLIRIHRKDANVELDKIVLTPGSYKPTGLGPAESRRN
jgi:hypothetical protein